MNRWTLFPNAKIQRRPLRSDAEKRPPGGRPFRAGTNWNDWMAAISLEKNVMSKITPLKVDHLQLGENQTKSPLITNVVR